MNIKDLVVGDRYKDINDNNDELIYKGVVKSGWYKGEHDFDGAGCEFSGGCICTDDEVNSDIEPLNTKHKE